MDAEHTESDAPSGCKHEKTDEHDGGVLNQTETTAHPVTDHTDENLADDDTNDFEVFDRVNPSFVADSVRFPAAGECRGEKRLDVANGEQDVTEGSLVQNAFAWITSNSPFEKKTSTRNNHVAHVVADRAQRVLLNHAANGF